MTTIDPSDVDGAIEQLLSVKKAPPGTEVNLPEELIIKVVRAAREIFMQQPILLEISAPLNICGDTHGQYADLLRLFEIGGFPPDSNYLFLGDYVDRAKQSIEVITLALCYKIKYTQSFFLLRGNHECASLNRIYGFYDECKRRYSVKLWRIFADCFNCMPVAAIVAEKILCMHGGLSPDLEDNLGIIFDIPRPTDVPDEGLLCDMLWSDPDPQVSGWGYNQRFVASPSSLPPSPLFPWRLCARQCRHDQCFASSSKTKAHLRFLPSPPLPSSHLSSSHVHRGVSYTFGPDVIERFLHKHDLNLICRAHQVVEDGYEFQCNRQLVTIFSAPNYCGEFDNAGAIMSVSEDLVCSFKIIRPSSHARKIRAREAMEKANAREGTL